MFHIDVIFDILKISNLVLYSKSFQLENSYYGFHSQSGRSSNVKIAFVVALAKPDQKCSIAFCI